MRNPERRLPRDLERLVADFAYYDCNNLLDVFLETTESHDLRQFVRSCKGSLFEIDLRGLQLTDAIGDLSKLPSTLKTLILVHCGLTSFNVAALPRGLEQLELSHNELTELDFTKLPPALTALMVWDNRLSSADLTKLPDNLKTVALNDNLLSSVNLNALPPNLTTILLHGNFLRDADFGTIPDDGRDTQVTGRGDQRTEHNHPPLRNAYGAAYRNFMFY